MGGSLRSFRAISIGIEGRSFLRKCERGRPSDAISSRGEHDNFLCESVIP